MSSPADSGLPRPVAGAPRPFHFPDFERSAAAGGGRVIAAHMPGRPMASALLIFDAGAVAEPPGREGVAELTARMLAEGTNARGAYEFAVAAERLGAAWTAEVDYDSLRVGFDVPVGELPAATELLAEAVREPAFRADSFDRVSAERLDELAVEWSQPGPRAAAAFAAALWAPGARYSRRPGGDPESVAAVALDEVRAFHRARLRPERSTLVVAGDLAGVDIAALAAAVFAGWRPPGDGTGGGAGGDTAGDTGGDAAGDAGGDAAGDAAGGGRAADGAGPARERGSGRRVVVVDRPGSVQSMLYMGHAAPPRRTPDYVAMTTLAIAFGGMLTSRLSYKLREEKGYTYGAHGAFRLYRDGGQFLMWAAVQREVTVPAIADAIAELERTAAAGVTAGELDAAKSFRVGVFPISFAQPHNVAGALGDLVVHDLPDDYFERVRADVAALPLAAATRAAAERLHPQDLLTVIVGDAGRVEGSLEEFGTVSRVE